MVAQTVVPLNPKVLTLDADDVIAFAPEVIQALLDFRNNQFSGVIEVHVSQGGIANVYTKVNRRYK